MDPDLPATDVSARIAELLNSGCSCVTLDRDALTVTGKTLGDNIASAETHDRNVIFPLEAPFKPATVSA